MMPLCIIRGTYSISAEICQSLEKKRRLTKIALSQSLMINCDAFSSFQRSAQCYILFRKSKFRYPVALLHYPRNPSCAEIVPYPEKKFPLRRLTLCLLQAIATFSLAFSGILNAIFFSVKEDMVSLLLHCIVRRSNGCGNSSIS